MTSKECELQLNQLIIDWDEDKATRLNATDIEAIKHLMVENQIQQDNIIKRNLAINDFIKIITKVEKYLKDNGIDIEMMESCNIYDVNGIELMKILRGKDETN